MTGHDVIEQFKALPMEERAKVAQFIVECDESWIPVDFREAMKDAEAGRLVDMEKVLSQEPPSRLQ